MNQGTQLQQNRTKLRNQVLTHSEENSAIHALNLPTGSGKTNASIEFTLKLALEMGKKQIIYVTPFTSFIEQTAKHLKEIFDEKVVLEHHCNFEFLDSENQHGNSFFIFDEVHTLPTLLLHPCLEAISILTQRYGCEALLMSATLPDFPPGWRNFRSIIRELRKLFALFYLSHRGRRRFELRFSIS